MEMDELLLLLLLPMGDPPALPLKPPPPPPDPLPLVECALVILRGGSVYLVVVVLPEPCPPDINEGVPLPLPVPPAAADILATTLPPWPVDIPPAWGLTRRTGLSALPGAAPLVPGGGMTRLAPTPDSLLRPPLVLI